MFDTYEVKPLVSPPWLQDDGSLTSPKNMLVNAYNEIVDLLQKTRITLKKNFIRIGYLLYTIKRGDLYQYAQKNKYDNYPIFIVDSFYSFCRDYFGFEKSSVDAYIYVYEDFGDGLGYDIKKEYENYGYSQLVEMLSLSDDERQLVSPRMKIKEIRALKKSTKTDEKVKETNQQTDKPAEEPAKPTTVFVDMKVKKDEFKKFVKYMFENYDYNLTLNGRKQGGQAFGGSLFDYLVEKGFFNA